MPTTTPPASRTLAPTAFRAAIVAAAAASLAACASDPRPTVPPPGADLAPFQAARAHATVAQDLEASGDIRGAIIAYQSARDADPIDYQWVAHRLAILHAKSGDPVAADIEFRRAWRLNPNDPAILADWNAARDAHQSPRARTTR